MRPAPTRPATPTISPALSSKRDVVDDLALGIDRVPTGDVLGLEHHLADFVLLARKQVLHLAADHHGDDLAGVELAHRLGADVRAVADDRHRVGDRRHLVDLVRDVDAGHAARPELSQQLQQRLGLGGGQRRRRLVENEQLGVLVEGLGDFDELLLAARVGQHRQRDVDVGHLQLVHQRRRPGVHRFVVDEPEAPSQFRAEEDVLRHRQVRHHHQFLVDDDDPRVFRLTNRVGLELLALPQDRPFPGAVRMDGRKHFHQRRLAGAVLAAESDDLAWPNLQVDPANRLDAGEFLGDAAHLQKIFGHKPSSRNERLWASTAKPSLATISRLRNRWSEFDQASRRRPQQSTRICEKQACQI